MAIVLPMDGFHYSRQELQTLALQPEFDHGSYEDLLRRRGAPWTFDAEGLCRALLTARSSGSGSFPMYSREISDPLPHGAELAPSIQVVLVEGNYLLLWADKRWAPLRTAFDESWFLRCSSREAQRERLIARHLKTWTPEKSRLWGEGRMGAACKVDANDALNLAMIEATSSNADRIILSLDPEDAGISGMDRT